VILADEPTGNLDETTRDEIMALLIDLWTRRGTTLIVVTHDGSVAGRALRRTQLDAGSVTERRAREVV
jgi:putative ABC transport system ATP-binding protein